MPKTESIRRHCIEMTDEGDKRVFAAGDDGAILGITPRDDVHIVVYDAADMVHIFRCRDGMSFAETADFFCSISSGRGLGNAGRCS